MTANAVRQARAFQSEIRARDDAALRELVASWRKVRTDLIRQERAFLDRLVAKHGTLDKLTPNQLYRVERLDALIAQVEQQVKGWSTDAHRMVTDSRSMAATLAAEHAAEYAALSGFGGMTQVTPVLNVAAFESAVARTRTEAVRGLFDKLPKATGKACRELIVNGVGTGRSPLLVARDLARATDMPGWAAARISRTEMMTAYREGSLDSWRRSPVVQSWVWLTAGDNRVCPVCRAMEGTEHALSEPFATHPSCRCTPVPQTATWGDLMGSDFADIEESVDRIPLGDETFAKLSAEQQRIALGPGRYEVYSSGTPLRDMVRVTDHPVWGPGRELIPLYELR